MRVEFQAVRTKLLCVSYQQSTATLPYYVGINVQTINVASIHGQERDDGVASFSDPNVATSNYPIPKK